MKFLVLADIHSDIEKLSKILDSVDGDAIDAVLFSGDVVDEHTTPHGFTLTDMIDVFVQKLLVFGKPTFCVPGNIDPLDIIDIYEDYGINIHNKKKKIKDLTIIGWGGALTPFNTSFEPPEGETREALERLTTNLTGEFILLLHNPPKDTKLDLVGGKHVGSAAEKELVEKKKPLLVLSAHIHESPGIDKIGDTTIFYPGPVFNGHYGIVEINGKRVKCVSKKITSAA